MPIATTNMEGLQTVLRVSVENTRNLTPATESIAKDWSAITARSFATHRSPSGKKWAPNKNGSSLGFKTGAMARGQGARALPTSVQGLGGPFYSKFFKSGTKLGNRAVGARKAKGDRRRRKRGTSLKGKGAKVQPSREIGPIEERGGKAVILDQDFMDRSLAKVAAHVAGKELPE